MNLSYQIEIEAPPELVFNLVSDIENLNQWMDGLIESEYISEFDTNNPLGVTFRQRASEMGQEIEYEGKIIAYEKPQCFGIRIANRNFTAEMNYHLTPIRTGTQLNYSAMMTINSFKYRLLASAFSSMAEKGLARRLKNLKALAESQST